MREKGDSRLGGNQAATNHVVQRETAMTMSINEIVKILEPLHALHNIGAGNAVYQQCLAQLIKASRKEVIDMTVLELMELDRRATMEYHGAAGA
jgi:hypothetical protein